MARFSEAESISPKQGIGDLGSRNRCSRPGSRWLVSTRYTCRVAVGRFVGIHSPE
jgi:hypothetical protein